MRKNIKRLILSLTIFMLGTLIFTQKSHANNRQGLELKINTVIVNYDEVPNNIRNKTLEYAVRRITNMTRYTASEALSRNRSQDAEFKFKHGESSTVFFTIPNSQNYDLLWFTPSPKTEANISLEAVSYQDNLRPYTYDDGGRAKPITPFNWLEVINSPGGRNNRFETAEVTLYFRYNPNIDEIPMEEPDINPTYSKKIDYLGNKETGAGEETENVNYYRLHLDFNAGEDWREKDRERDIVFVLDVSNSMEERLGRSTRWQVLKNTLGKAVDKLSTNENNYISMVAFGTHANIITRDSNDQAALKRTVNNLRLPGGNEGGTNFYDAMGKASQILNETPQEREKIVFFISDGQPTASNPAANTNGFDRNTEVATAYAFDAASNLRQVDSFYSIFVGDEGGAASTLQTFSQMVDVTNEKYTVEALDETQLEYAFNRFLASLDISFNDVTIEDRLSEYADYASELKVHKFTEDGRGTELRVGVGYEVLGRNSDTVAIKILEEILPDTKYEVSFEIRVSDGAILEYTETGQYPHIGDPDTDYPGNTTSSERPGFYSNDFAELSYNFGSKDTITRTYPKPVMQVYDFNPIESDIQFEKNLSGKDLEDGEFEFTLSELVPNDEDGTEKIILVSRVRNQADGVIDFGDIKFSELGRHIFEVQEVIPESKEPGYTYDERILQVIVDVTRPEGKGLSVDVRYPDGTKFLNRYALETVSVNFQLRKEMLGKALQAGDFEFRLFDGNMQLIETVENRGNGDIIFSNVQFNKPSKYQFVVREVIPNPQDTNIIYDTVPAYISVDVYDNGGKLEADVNYENKEIFVNRYQREESRTEADLEFKVVLSGMQLSRNMFEFELIDSMGRTYLAKNNSKGDIYFEGINFNSVGSYDYTIRQKTPDNPISHMNYDEDTKQVIIKVTRDSASGGYGIDVDYDPNNIFYNKYKVSGRIW